MNWFGSGFITQLIYATSNGVFDDHLAILTEDSHNLLTENGFDIDTEN